MIKCQERKDIIKTKRKKIFTENGGKLTNKDRSDIKTFFILEIMQNFQNIKWIVEDI